MGRGDERGWRGGSGGVIAFGSRLLFAGLTGALRSECVCPLCSIAAICLRFTPVFFPLSGKKRRLAVSCVPIPPGRDRHSRVLDVSARLSGLAETRSWSARRCAFCRRACPRFTLGVAVLLGRLPSVHACCLPHGDKQDGLRWLAFLFRRVEIAIRAFSMCRRGYLPWRVHFGLGRFFVAISTGVPGMRGTRKRSYGAGGAAFVRLCAGELAL